jgi:hypothetical protein
MSSKAKRAILLVGLGLSGCIVVAQPQPQPQVVETYPPPSYPPPTYAPAPPPQPVQYQPPPPQVAVVYQDQLSTYGHWIDYPRYGQCWVPNYTPAGWQPYTVGHWVYTEDGSCCWVSEGDESAWGPTVYHYGQWACTPDMGWIWVPGTTWSPAWVAWRDGGGYCGWTPLPPEACYGGTVTYVVADQYCPPERYVYVDEQYVTVVNVNQHFAQNNPTIIRNTTNITNITVVNNRVVNGGIPTQNVERATGRAVPRLAVATASSPEEARALASRGVPVHYSSPAIEQAHTQVVAKKQQQLDRAEQVGQQRQTELTEQQKTDRQLQQQDQAARQQQTQLQEQIDNQKRIDQQKQQQLNQDTNRGNQLDNDAAKEAHRQQQEQQRQAQDQARQQQAEQQRQAQEQAKQQQEAERAREAEAQKQADADRRSAQDSQRRGQPQQNPPQHDNGNKPAQPKPKPKPGENQPPQ